ncbi:MAG: cytochrome c5 [Porticoccus sp.]|jgi:cytochrome c5
MSQLKKAGIVAVALTLVLGVAGCSSEQEELNLTAQQEKEMSKRLAPVGKVVLEKNIAVAAPAVAAGPRSGEDVYNKSCIACHSTGAAGAPKVGVATDWTARIDQGLETLYANAINGVRGMPAKGLCMNCSEDEVKATVDYMLEQSK